MLANRLDSRYIFIQLRELSNQDELEFQEKVARLIISLVAVLLMMAVVLVLALLSPKPGATESSYGSDTSSWRISRSPRTGQCSVWRRRSTAGL